MIADSRPDCPTYPVPKINNIRKGPSIRDNTSRGCRRTSEISFPRNALVRMNRLSSLCTARALAALLRVAFHQLDENFVEARPVFLDPAHAAIVGLKDIQQGRYRTSR